MKKIISIIITICILSAFIAMPVSAKTTIIAYGKCGEGVNWLLDETGTLTISGSGDMYNRWNIGWKSYSHLITTVYIKDGVTSICEDAFFANGQENYQFTSIDIPESVTKIGVRAFKNCTSLEEISLPSELIEISSQAFCGCSGLENIIVPESVTSIGSFAFSECGLLTEICLPQEITTINTETFHECRNLESVTIVGDITSIDANAFYGCDNLKDVYYSGTISDWKKVSISKTGNVALSNATIHYSSRPLSGIGSFEDFETSDWAYDEVLEAYTEGLIPGEMIYETMFNRVNRAEFAAIAVKLYEKIVGDLPDVKISNTPFADCNPNGEYSSYIAIAYKLGITNGTSQNQFSPYSYITREELVTMLYRVINLAEKEGKYTFDSGFNANNSRKFYDHSDISDFAIEPVYFMSENGVVKGVDGVNFKPLNVASKEEAIITSLRCIKYLFHN